MKFLKKFTQFLNEKESWSGLRFFYAVLEDEAHYFFGTMRLYSPKMFKNHYPSPVNPKNFDFSGVDRFGFEEDCLETLGFEDKCLERCGSFFGTDGNQRYKEWSECRDGLREEFSKEINSCIDSGIEYSINQYKNLTLFNKLFLVCVDGDYLSKHFPDVLFSGSLGSDLNYWENEFKEGTIEREKIPFFMELREGGDEEDEEINWDEVAKRVVPFVEETSESTNLYLQIKQEIPQLWGEIEKLSGNADTYAQAGSWGL